MKISIMYRLMLLLMLNKKVTREYAATKFEVSTRSIQRYIDALCEAGVPITPISGRRGGYSIPDSYKLPCTLFTSDEIDRIKASISGMSMSFGDMLNEELLEKLATISNSGVKSYIPSIMIDAGAWNNPEALRSKLDVIAVAIENRNVIDINYIDKNEQVSRRLLDPYSLVLKEGIWYVYGWCHIREEFRLFRLARMRTIDYTDEIFISQEGADLSQALTPLKNEECRLIIEFGEAAHAQIEEWLGEECIKVNGDGYNATAVVPLGQELIYRLLSLGGAVKVMSPKQVVDKLNHELLMIQAHYKKD